MEKIDIDEIEKNLPRNEKGEIIGADMGSDPNDIYLVGPKGPAADSMEVLKRARELAGYGDGAIMVNPYMMEKRDNGPAADAVFFWDV